MKTTFSKSAYIALAIMAMSVAAGCASTAAAKTDPVETAFWNCDREANTGMLGSSEAGSCSENFEAFKTARFDGDFTKLLAYYQANKQKYSK